MGFSGGGIFISSSGQLSSNVVTTAKILDANITIEKLASDISISLSQSSGQLKALIFSSI